MWLLVKITPTVELIIVIKRQKLGNNSSCWCIQWEEEVGMKIKFQMSMKRNYLLCARGYLPKIGLPCLISMHFFEAVEDVFRLYPVWLHLSGTSASFSLYTVKVPLFNMISSSILDEHRWSWRHCKESVSLIVTMCVFWLNSGMIMRKSVAIMFEAKSGDWCKMHAKIQMALHICWNCAYLNYVFVFTSLEDAVCLW